MLDEPLGTVGRPSQRGRLHFIALVSVIPLLVVLAIEVDGARARAAVVMYAIGLCTMLAVSTTYHRWVHTIRARAAWRRADHAAILLAIDGAGAFASVEQPHGNERGDGGSGGDVAGDVEEEVDRGGGGETDGASRAEFGDDFVRDGREGWAVVGRRGIGWCGQAGVNGDEAGLVRFDGGGVDDDRVRSGGNVGASSDGALDGARYRRFGCVGRRLDDGAGGPDQSRPKTRTLATGLRAVRRRSWR